MQIHTQNEADKLEQIAIWERDFKPDNLAETDANIGLLAHRIRTKYTGIFTADALRESVEFLQNELQWLAVPAKPEPKKGTVSQRLAQLGLSVSKHQSHTDRESQEKQSDARFREAVDGVAAIKRRRELQSELLEAAHLTIHYENGTRCGAINHGKTETERNLATDRVKQKIRQFNQQHPQHSIDVYSKSN